MTLVLEREVSSAQPGAQDTQRQPLEWHVFPFPYHSTNGHETDAPKESPPVSIFPTDTWTLPQLLSCYFAAQKNGIPIRMSAIDPATGEEDSDESRTDTINAVVLERGDDVDMAHFFGDFAQSLPENVIPPLPPIDNTVWAGSAQTTDERTDEEELYDDGEPEAGGEIGHIPAPLQFSSNGHAVHGESGTEQDPEENGLHPHGLTLVATHLYTGSAKERVVSEQDTPSEFVRFPWGNKGNDGSAFSFRHCPEEGGVVRILDYDGKVIDTFHPGENAELVIGYGRDAIYLEGRYSATSDDDDEVETGEQEDTREKPTAAGWLPGLVTLPHNPWHIPQRTGEFSDTDTPDTDLMFDRTQVQKPARQKVWEIPQSQSERVRTAAMRIVSPIAHLGESIRNGTMVVLHAPRDSVRDFIAIQKRAAAIKARMNNADALQRHAGSVDHPLDDQQGLPEEARSIDQALNNPSFLSAVGSRIGSIAHDVIFAFPQSIHDFREIQRVARERREFWKKFDQESQKTDPGAH